MPAHPFTAQAFSEYGLDLQLAVPRPPPLDDGDRMSIVVNLQDGGESRQTANDLLYQQLCNRQAIETELGR